jgi:hypothetical protein
VPSSSVLKPVKKEFPKDELEKKPEPSEIPSFDDRSNNLKPSDDAYNINEVSN